jgi:hypothetical protein
VETQQQAQQLLCTLFGQTILGNVGQPETPNSAHPYIFSTIGKHTTINNMDYKHIFMHNQLNNKNT